MTPAAALLVLTAVQVHNLNLVLQEAPNDLALRAEAIFLTESSAGIDHKHRDVYSHGWFQLQLPTACLIAGYKHSCPISAQQLETDSNTNLKLGIEYIKYCAENFPASESRAIACHRWGVPQTKAMSEKRLKRLEKPNGYVGRVLEYEKQLRAIPVSHE